MATYAVGADTGGPKPLRRMHNMKRTVGKPPMVVRERTPGTWEVTSFETLTGGSTMTSKGTAVWYYGSSTWRCESCGPIHGASILMGMDCRHLGAVLNSNPTRCGFEGDCTDIACGTTRVDGAVTPVCPTHRQKDA
jgi:hypothetical protein